METVRLTRGDLPPHLPLIGFAGAPFTLASYAIEGGSSRSYLHTKTLMYRDDGAWRELMERFSRAVVRYLNAQIAAGAQAVQLFDSWVGCLGVDDYRRYVLPHVQTSHCRPRARRACDPLRHGKPGTEPAAGRGRRLRRGRRLAHAAGRRLASDRNATGDSGQPGADRPAGGSPLAPPTRSRTARHGGRPARPHLQPGTRRVAPDPRGQRRRAGGRRSRVQSDAGTLKSASPGTHATLVKPGRPLAPRGLMH